MTHQTPQSPRDRQTAKISVVLPVFNESAILQELNCRIITVLERTTPDFEIVYVNDGSSDGSRERLNNLARQDRRVVVVHLSRNFGHQPAVHAGLEHACGDVVVVMDSDLQDNPEAIPAFLNQWESGSDVVYAQRTTRKESLPKRALFYSFYRVLNAIADSPIPADAGNFGLLDRSVVDAVLSLPERERFFPGLRSWAGFRQTGVPVERAARHDDTPRVSLRGLIRLAKTAIFSFSSFPLKFFYIIAGISGTVCLATMGFVLWHRFLTGLAIPGWASVIITASFFGSLNALGISILGEYVIRIYDQVRSRPVYLKAETLNVNSRRELVPQNESRSPVDELNRIEELLATLQREYSSPEPRSDVRQASRSDSVTQTEVVKN
ncbi:MAG: glycosyltransferase family 2 protein [Planctomycetaceae bacterium]|nr:glycosyltransferase family 2 protein [Planctomycetaceae bacterium]